MSGRFVVEDRREAWKQPMEFAVTDKADGLVKAWTYDLEYAAMVAAALNTQEGKRDWQSKKPTASGWYWVRLAPDDFRVIVRVAYPVLGPDELIVLDYYGNRTTLVDKYWNNALWWGPVAEPPL